MARRGMKPREALTFGVWSGIGTAVGGALAVLLLARLLRDEDGDTLLVAGGSGLQAGDGDGSSSSCAGAWL